MERETQIVLGRLYRNFCYGMGTGFLVAIPSYLTIWLITVISAGHLVVGPSFIFLWYLDAIICWFFFNKHDIDTRWYEKEFERKD